MLDKIIVSTVVIGGMGGIFGLGLSYASKVFAIKTDERVVEVRAALPGANCGGCGFPGCDGFAAALVEGTSKVNGCPVGGEETALKLGEIMGMEVSDTEYMAARVFCNGKCSVSNEKYVYNGMDDCFAASQIFGGHKSCVYGCLGHGNCARACPFNAIYMVGGVAKIIEGRCKACGVCIAACPKSLIEIVPVAKCVSVLCKSKDKGPVTKTNCEVGCIGCTKCVKACNLGAITMEGPLAKIDPAKCTNCEECIKVCPTMAIRRLNF